MMVWEDYWRNFLEREGLNNKVEDLNALDDANNRDQRIEQICKAVFDVYDFQDEARLENVRLEFLKHIDRVAHVHLSTSRVKTIDSVLRKIITKRHETYEDKNSPYADLTEETYGDAITDLVGVRVILSYRGDWASVHHDLLNEFPLRAKESYNEGILPHEMGTTFIAEWPKVYHAYGDDVSLYEKEGLTPILHKKGYRSVHYTVSFMDTYIELQVRTIYDEAWSDVDHRYVYKQEANPSNEALKELSFMLCQLTNLANDIGEQMRTVYYEDKMSRVAEDGCWLVTPECKNFFVEVTDKLGACKKSFGEMCSQMKVE